MRKIFLICVLIVFLIASCASLKPHPRPWTKGEKIAAGYFIIAHTANAYSTESFRDRGISEKNPIMGDYPSDTEIGLYFSITGLVAIAFSHWYPELRKPLLMTYGTINVGWTIHDSRLD